MLRYCVEDIYMTLCGEIEGEHAVPGVANAYAVGSACTRLYNEAMEAYERLRIRLGKCDEDPDAEIIIGNLLSIQHILCVEMFRYGQLLR